MNRVSLSKLLYVWLFANGHEFLEFKEGVGITTRKDGKPWRFDLCGTYGGIVVKYRNKVFYFYKDGELITQTDLNEFA